MRMQAPDEAGLVQLYSALCHHSMDLRTRSLPRQCTEASKEREFTWEDYCGLLLCTVHKQAYTYSILVMPFCSVHSVQSFWCLSLCLY